MKDPTFFTGPCSLMYMTIEIILNKFTIKRYLALPSLQLAAILSASFIIRTASVLDNKKFFTSSACSTYAGIEDCKDASEGLVLCSLTAPSFLNTHSRYFGPSSPKSMSLLSFLLAKFHRALQSTFVSPKNRILSFPLP